MAVRVCRTYCDESGAPEWPQTKRGRPTRSTRGSARRAPPRRATRRATQIHNICRGSVRHPRRRVRTASSSTSRRCATAPTPTRIRSACCVDRSRRSQSTTLRCTADDTLLLHTGDFDERSLQRLVLAPFTALPISFVRLPEKYWSLPPWLNETLGPVARNAIGKMGRLPILFCGLQAHDPLLHDRIVGLLPRARL